MENDEERLAAFGEAFPQLPEGEAAAAYENFRQYVALAVQIARCVAPLTAPQSRATVSAGSEVEPQVPHNSIPS